MREIEFLSNEPRELAERWTSRVLRLGVMISAGLMILGLLLAAFFPSLLGPLLTSPSLGSLAGRMVSMSFDPATLMYAGLVMLMVTPVLRVITAVFGFAFERDWRFVIVSSMVLCMLVGEIIYSIYLKG